MSLYKEKDTVVDYKSQSFTSTDKAPSRSYGNRKDQRPPVPIDPPTLTRIYRSTAQRVKLSIQSLRSDAVFLLVCDEDKQVIAWFGRESSAEDREIALKVGLEITIKDYSNVESEDIPVLLEDFERSVQLRYFLDKLWEDESTYRSESAKEARRHIVINSPVTIYQIEKIIGGNFLMKEIKRGLPDENGTIHRLAFAPIEKDSIVAISYGDQWDLWIARGSLQDLDSVQTFLGNMIASQPSLTISGWDSDPLQNIRIVKQGCERRLFRLPFKLLTNFEPVGKTIPYSVYSAYDKQYDMSGDKKSRQIEDSTENSDQYDENGNYIGDENGEYYDEQGYYEGDGYNNGQYEGGEYDGYYYDPNGYYDPNAYYDPNYYDPNGYYDPNYYDPNAAYYQDPNAAYQDPSQQNGFSDNNSAFSGVSGASGKEKKVVFDDGFSQQDGALTELNPLATPRSSVRIDAPRSISYIEDEDLPRPSIISEMRDRKKNPGKYMLNQESLTFREADNVGPEVRMELLEQSIRNPRILIGWQVEIDEGIYAGIRVITGIRKTLFAKTEYRLSRRNFDRRIDSYSSAFDDAWIRLKRLRLKGGLSFRLLRQVITIGEINSFSPLAPLSKDKSEELQ